MNLPSIAAAHGVMVAVFQWGWAGGIIGIGHTGPIDPWIPLTMFTILFGLSMEVRSSCSRASGRSGGVAVTIPRRSPTGWP